MIKKIEHLGIAVADLKQATHLFEVLLNRKAYKEETVPSEGVTTVFFELGESKVELLGAMHEESAIYKYLQKRGQGIHHVAVEVDDIHAEMERLRAAGFELINEEPKEGADNKLICFVHPRSTGGVLLELCQEKHPAQ
jgi:methylmalonyl-CoA/ethylmalonyl-CoA epimerase